MTTINTTINDNDDETDTDDADVIMAMVMMSLQKERHNKTKAWYENDLLPKIQTVDEHWDYQFWKRHQGSHRERHLKMQLRICAIVSQLFKVNRLAKMCS